MKTSKQNINLLRIFIFKGVNTMHKFYYLTGAMVLVLGGLGIYSSQAGNKMMSNPEGVVIIEEAVYTVAPASTNTATPQPDTNTSGGFMPLPEDKGVEVAPIPETQTPNLEQNPPETEVIEENISENVE